jgi:hypothetical protein
LDYREFLSLTTVALLSWSIPGIQARAATPAQEAALRAQVNANSISHGWKDETGRGLRVGGVVSEGIWALVGFGGSTQIYKLDKGSWTLITGGGGVYSAEQLNQLGVPLETAKILVARLH